MLNEIEMERELINQILSVDKLEGGECPIFCV